MRNFICPYCLTLKENEQNETELNNKKTFCCAEKRVCTTEDKRKSFLLPHASMQ